MAKKPQAERLGEIDLYGGHGTGEVIREADPDGGVVTHAYRRDATVVDRMLKAGTIDNDQHQAAERFRMDFERAKLMGRYGSVKLDRAGGASREHISDVAIAAREAVNFALSAVGRHGQAAKAVWFVVGEQLTLDEFAARMRWSGTAMNPQRAAGLLTGALESLVLHYGIVRPRDLRDREYARGVRMTLDRVARLCDDVAASWRGDDGRKALGTVAAMLRKENARRGRGGDQ